MEGGYLVNEAVAFTTKERSDRETKKTRNAND